MNNDIDDLSKIALASVGIYFTSKKIKDCEQIVQDYIANSRVKSNQDLPVFDPNCILSLICNGICYSIKVILFAPNEYAVISWDNYSFFKVTGKQNNIYKIIWKLTVFSVHINQNSNNFQIIINENNSVNVHKVENFTQSCSPIYFINDHVPTTDKLNSVLEKCLSNLNHILNGFVLPEPFFQTHLIKELETMFSVLRDPLLPSLQFQNLLEINESSIPSVLLNELQQIIAQYISNHSSVFSRFPSIKILSLINKYIDSIGDQSTKFSMMTVLRPILELAEMYSDGIRGNTKHLIDKILEDYRRVEVKFQTDENISNMNIINKSLSVSDVFSHNRLAEKNKLIMYLIDYLEKYLPGLILDLKPTINKLLNSLNGRMYSQVISKLREVLITGQIPSYEVRKNQIEAIFLNSISHYSNSLSTGRLESLIYSNTEMFDIISDFFYHKMFDLRKCALEVYIRRAYMAYEIHSFKQSQLQSGQLGVAFQFTRSISNKNLNVPTVKRSNSFVTLNNSPNTNCGLRKDSQLNRRSIGKVSPFYLDKDDACDGFNNDLLNEYNLMDDKIWNTKPHDNDADSAISIGAHSMSEMSATVSDQVDFDSIGETFAIQNHYSPSARSLEEIPNIEKTSNMSLDSLVTYKWKRNASIYSSQLPSYAYDDFLGNMDLGIMIIFNTLEEVDRNLDYINELTSQPDLSDCSNYLDYDYVDENKPLPQMNKVVLNISLCDSELTLKSDNEVSKILHMFCARHSDYLNEINVSRITFLLQSMDKSLRYFTFRGNNNFEEDFKVRQIDPALSFQLEINRLRNYHLERLPVLNRRMYVYMGRLKTNLMNTTAEYRMFVRCIIHHNDINSSTTNVDFMAREAEKSLVESMDAIDIAWIDERANFSSSNHIFFYFHSILCLDKIDELESVVRTIVLKFGHRLWSMRITQAELKLSVKLNNDSLSPIPIRLWVHNEGGKSLDISVYREEFHNNKDHKILMSWYPNKEGRYHGVPVDCFYSI